MVPLAGAATASETAFVGVAIAPEGPVKQVAAAMAAATKTTRMMSSQFDGFRPDGLPSTVYRADHTRQFDQGQTSACTQFLPWRSHFGTILHPLEYPTSRTLGDRFVVALSMMPGLTMADAPTIPVRPTPNANRAGNRNVRMRISSEWSGSEPGSRPARRD
jgi:hypothetical protein